MEISVAAFANLHFSFRIAFLIAIAKYMVLNMFLIQKETLFLQFRWPQDHLLGEILEKKKQYYFCKISL
jgi:hypothetical protein